jgi:hypothetical protein
MLLGKFDLSEDEIEIVFNKLYHCSHLPVLSNLPLAPRDA